MTAERISLLFKFNTKLDAQLVCLDILFNNFYEGGGILAQFRPFDKHVFILIWILEQFTGKIACF